MNLKNRRNALHLSQSRLARLSGVSRFHICLHELGDKALCQEDLARVANAIRQEAQRLHKLSGPIATGEDDPKAA